MRTFIDVTISVHVYDVRAFVRAAQKQAVKDGLYGTTKEAREMYNAHDLGACAQMLLDPGKSPPGCSIEQSTSEEVVW